VSECQTRIWQGRYTQGDWENPWSATVDWSGNAFIGVVVESIGGNQELSGIIGMAEGGRVAFIKHYRNFHDIPFYCLTDAITGTEWSGRWSSPHGDGGPLSISPQFPVGVESQ